MKTATETRSKMKIFLFLLCIIGLAIMAGCGSNHNDQQAIKSDNKVKTYFVGTRGTFKPFNYVDDKEQLTGYDIEILREVQKRNKDINFEFKTMSLESAFIGLNASQIDVIANQLTRNADRIDKYTFTKEANNYGSFRLMVKGDRDDIQTKRENHDFNADKFSGSVC